MGISNQEYDALLAKTEGKAFFEYMAIGALEKFAWLIKVSRTPYNILTLAGLIQQMFRFSHSFRVEQKYPLPDSDSDKEGLLSLNIPPTPYIPLFHHSFEPSIVNKSFLAQIEIADTKFNLSKIYDSTRGVYKDFQLDSPPQK